MTHSALFDLHGRTTNMYNNITDAVKQLFPIEGNKHTIELGGIELKSKDNLSLDYIEQGKLKDNKGTLKSDLYADLTLKDKTTGKVLDKAKVRLLSIPVVTGRGTYIVKGTEYTINNQFRLKPGVYNRITDNGMFVTEFNMQGAAFKINFNPTNNRFTFLLGGSKSIPVYSVLKDLGMSDSEMQRAWGDKIYHDNKSIYNENDILKFHKKTERFKPTTNIQTAVDDIKKEFSKWKVDPNVTKITLGKEHNQVDAAAMLDSTVKLIKIAKNEVEPDDRDSLEFKNLYSAEDFAKERLLKNARSIKQKIKNNLDRKDSVRDILNYNIFNNPIETLFTTSNLAATPEQTNPLSFLSDLTKLTVTGEGGIENERAITDGMRNVHVSHLNFVDILHTPESNRVGVTAHAPIGLSKIGTTPTTRLWSVKDKDYVNVDPVEMLSKVTAFNDQYDWSSGTPKAKSDKVKAVKNKKEGYVSSKEVDYIQSDPTQMFGFNSNLIPMLPAVQSNRSMMAAKHMDQAVSLIHREAPLVQSKLAGSKVEDASYEKLVGFMTNSTSPVDGKVTKIDDEGYIHIKDERGKEHKVANYKNFHLNQKSFMDSTPLVKVGDTVKKGQTLSDHNYSKNGALAIGTNLRVGYVPYKSLTFEDATVISESAAKKLTSEHLAKESIPKNADHIHDLYKFTAIYPSVINAAQKSLLGDDGIVKVGTKVSNGDPLAVYLKKTTPTAEQALLGKFNKHIMNYRPNVIKWEKNVEGEVVKVNRHIDGIDIFVKTSEPMVIGDKVSGRAGNKGIVAAIIPDAEMPHTEDGRPLDIIMNPMGVIGRINPAQIYEAALGKVAEKTGKPFVIKNFNEDEAFDKKVQAILKKHGISDREHLIDPKLGKTENPVLVGNEYILKLKHKVEDKGKTTMRGYKGPYTSTTDQPTRGGGIGGQAVDPMMIYSLLSHGSRANLAEFATYKSAKNDELWRAVENNQMLPAPKTSKAFSVFADKLKAIGINVEKKGRNLQLIPFLDKDVSKISRGEITEPKMVYSKDLSEEKGGLFDKNITGGLEGSRWSSIHLPEKILNPLFEENVASITDNKIKDIEAIMRGDLYVNKSGEVTKEPKGAHTCGKGLEILLSKVDIKKDIKSSMEAIKKAKGADLNKLNKKIRYLEALKNQNIHPTELLIQKIPVLPPNIRPMYPTDSGDLRPSDINILYKDIVSCSNSLKEAKHLPDEDKKETRNNVYDSVKALYGLGDPVNQRAAQSGVKGILKELSGTQPKTGYFQSRVISKRQNLSGRTTITPNPDLHMDECGIPRKMARVMFEPFVKRELTKSGYSNLDADKAIKDKLPAAERALEKVVSERPVMLNRSPSLHKFSVLAFQPKLTDKSSIEIPPVVVSGYNADFDGNCILGSSKIVLTLPLQTNIFSFEILKEEIDMKFGKDTKVLAITKDGVVIETEIEKFPHEESFVLDKNGARVYNVPEGIKVWTYNHENSENKFCEVDKLTIEDNCDLVDVTTNKKYKVSASTNESLCAYDHASGDLIKVSPEKSVGKLMPITVGVPAFGNINDFELGWMIGSFVSDGFLCDNYFGYTKLSDKHRERFSIAVNNFEGKTVKFNTYRDVPSDNKLGFSAKDHYYNSDKAMSLFENCYHSPRVPGQSALSKKLPNIFEYGKETLLGILSGLLDGDGSVSISNAKNKPQILVNYSTSSKFLTESVETLMMMLGIRCSVTPYEPKEGRLQKHTAYVINISSVDIKKISNELKLTNEDKSKILDALHKSDEMKDDLDIVPIPNEVINIMASKVGPCKSDNSLCRSLATIKSKNKPNYYVTRRIAKKMIRYIDESSIVQTKWKKLVENESIHWCKCESSSNLRKETVYDLVVPETKVFSTNGGLVVYDTMSIHVPLTNAAVKEAYDTMLPSKALYSPVVSNKMMISVSHEPIMGLYYLTQEGKHTSKKYATLEEAKKDMFSDKVHANDVVTIAGKKTTIGRAMVNELLPSNLHVDHVLDKNGVKNLMNKIAKIDPKDFGTKVNQLKKLGDDYAFKKGVTIGLDDLKTDHKLLDSTFKALDAKFQKMKKTGDVTKDLNMMANHYSKGLETVSEQLFEKNKGNNMVQMVRSGSRGEPLQLRQMIFAPGIVQDTNNKPIPVPIRNSYSSGLDLHDYFISTYGARKGMIQKVVSQQDPGALAKEFLTNSIGTVISENDCGTKNGLDVNIDDRSLNGRYLCEDIGGVSRNTLLTNDIIDRLKKHGVKTLKVRSPLTCESEHGICSHCYGPNEHGNITSVGTNVGAIAGQGMVEPISQMMLKAFHTGGIHTTKSDVGDTYKRAEELFRFPKILKNKATIAPVKSTVKAIEKNPGGGWNVHLEDIRGGKKKEFIGANVEPSIKVGDKVDKGDRLSTGFIQPHELIKHKGIMETRKYLTDEMSKVWHQYGIDKPVIETAVKSLTNLTRIKSAPDTTGMIPGDITSYSKVEKHNRKLIDEVKPDDGVGHVLHGHHDIGPKRYESGTPVTESLAKELNNYKVQKIKIKKEPIVHEPILRGTNSLTMYSPDWIAKMNYKNIKDTLIEGVSRNATSDIHSYHPVPGYAYGAEFNKPEMPGGY